MDGIAADGGQPSAPVEKAVITDAPSKAPELGSQTPVAPKPEVANPEAPKDNASAVRRAVEEAKAKAQDAVKAKEQAQAKTPEPKAEAKTPETDPRTRNEQGKFASKESAQSTADNRAVQAKTEGDQTSEGRKPSHEPPARFADSAKRDWANVPESVREDVHRVISENEKGIQKYKADAENFERVRQYDELAKKNGREGVHESLKQVVEIEDAFSRNPIEGFKKISDHFGINLQAVAAHILGQNPNQQVQEAHGRIRELEAKIQQMEFAQKAPAIVDDFFSRNPDADSDDTKARIAFLIRTGKAEDLESAWEFIKLFSPPASNAGNSQTLRTSESAVAHTQAPAEIQPNQAGSKSVSGAPSGGVSPAAKKLVPSNNADAVKNAIQRARNS